jgi:hypothetical protein
MSKLVEIPGQYTLNQEPNLQNNHKVVEVCKDVDSVEKSRNIMRILSLRSNNGKIYQYVINNRGSSSNSQEYLLSFLNNQLKQIMNVKLNDYRETCARNMSFKISGEYFANSQVSIIEHKARFKSINDLMDEYLVSKDIDYDYALDQYLKENTFGNAQAKQEIFKKMDSTIPNNLIKNYALRSVNNLDEFFWFRRNFTTTFGMENLFSYLISNGIFPICFLNSLELNLENMYIDPAKGHFFYLGMKPSFNDQGQITKSNAQTSIRISKNFEVVVFTKVLYS